MSNTEDNNNVEIDQHQQHGEQEDQLTLRALVSTKEAGVIIGKGGKNVAELRESTGVKAGVSKVVQGVHDRVLTVSGTLEGVAKVSFLDMRMR
jgi:heterogeneous nuclear rnp K-like protein 2